MSQEQLADERESLGWMLHSVASETLSRLDRIRTSVDRAHRAAYSLDEEQSEAFTDCADSIGGARLFFQAMQVVAELGLVGRIPSNLSADAAAVLIDAAASVSGIATEVSLMPNSQVYESGLVDFAVRTLLRGARSYSELGDHALLYAYNDGQNPVVEVADNGSLRGESDVERLLSPSGQLAARYGQRGRYYRGLTMLAVGEVVKWMGAGIELTRADGLTRFRLRLPGSQFRAGDLAEVQASRRSGTFESADSLLVLFELMESLSHDMGSVASIHSNLGYLDEVLPPTEGIVVREVRAALLDLERLTADVNALTMVACLRRRIRSNLPAEPAEVIARLERLTEHMPEHSFELRLPRDLVVPAPEDVCFALRVLIFGALDHSPQGRPIRVSVYVVEGRLMLQVADHGSLQESGDMLAVATPLGQRAAKEEHRSRYYEGCGLVAVGGLATWTRGGLYCEADDDKIVVTFWVPIIRSSL